MTSSDLDNLVADYMTRLDSALRGLPPSRRQQLVADIRQHVADSRAEMPSESEAAIRDLLDRVGLPEDIAAEAQANQPPRRPRVSRRLVLGMVGAVVVVAAAIAVPLAVTGAQHRTRTPSPSPTSTVASSAVVTVPEVVGQTAAKAGQILGGLGLKVSSVLDPSLTVAPGLVVRQSPAAGTRVLAGSIVTTNVTIRLSTGPPTGPVSLP